jgi:hypothetical protein
VATKRVKNEEESIDTAHPTQLNPRQHEPLGGRMSSFTANNGA